MLLVTNPGSNLSAAVVERYDVRVTPQKIVVDGEEHDTRGDIDFEEIDRWVATAREHPYVLGTSAAEFASFFRELAKDDRELFAVMTSRKIINSYDSAVSARRTLKKQAQYSDLRIAIGDCGSTDIGAGLAVILAGEARRAGLSLDQIAELIEAYRLHSRLAFMVDTLDNLVKGGRASALRAWLANVMKVRPLIGFVDGELKPLAKIRTHVDPSDALAQHFSEQLSAGRGVWAAVFHGNAPARGHVVAEQLRRTFDVRFCYVRPLSPSIYLHTGPGSVGAVVVPLDKLPWTPTGPADL